MKYSDLVQVKPLTVRPDTAERMLEAPHLFQEMVKAGWIKPIFKANRCTLYAVEDLEGCVERLKRGEIPSTP